MPSNASNEPSVVQDRAGQKAQSLLRTAMKVQKGEMPELSGDILFDQDGMLLTSDAFIFSTPRGVVFHYRRGGAVTFEFNEGASKEEFELFLWGTVYGAVAWLNGLVPLHASAVVMNGQCIGFAAQSGGGKSTVAAALTVQGHALVCDDTLVLAPSKGGMMAIPDGKPMKLWADMIERLDLGASTPIAAVPGKHFAQVSNRTSNAQKLDHLVFLEEGSKLEIERVRGSAKLNLLSVALYREELHLALHDHDFHAKMMLGMADSLEIWRLHRPMNRETFEADMEATNQAISNMIF